MVEQPVMVETGREKITLDSSAAAISSVPLQARPSDYCRYPPPLATYEEVVASPTLFRETLEKVHAAMGTKFMIPTVGGRDLDLHCLFVLVTSRGGINKVLQERKWKDITGAFNFPSSATNASFVLRKYYFSLLHHYEQIYFFKAEGWSPEATGAMQFSSSKVLPHRRTEPARSSPITKPAIQQESTKFLPEESAVPSTGSEVFGVIDGKFESGYLITVKIGSEEFKGVLYQSPLNPSQQATERQSNQQCQSISVNKTKSPAVALGVGRRKRRKKSEIKKRDPAHPKPNRSGYNFFFAEQHARLKPLYPGKDRDISRMIGESWNKLEESDRAVYQEKAARDKERYRLEMERYRERPRTGQIISSALPIRQQSLCPNSGSAMDVDQKYESEDATSSRSTENVTSLNKNNNIELSVGQTIADGDAMQRQSLRPDLNLMDLDKTFQTEDAFNIPDNDARQGDKRNLEDHSIIEKGGEVELTSVQESRQGYASRETLAIEELFEVQKRADMDGNGDKECSGNNVAQNDKKGSSSDEGISISIKGKVSATDEQMDAQRN